jgi:TPR repeat protein
VEQELVEAARLLKLAAEGGFAMAQDNLGCCYTNGDRVEQDDVEAVRWFRAAAAQAFSVAQLNLGWMYRNGRRVDRDYVEARRWYTLVAQQGDSMAQHNLGLMHYHGRGGPVDYAAAATWLKRAADQGQPKAITYLPLALNLLFPPGTPIELVNMPAAMINGIKGVVDAAPDGKIVCSDIGKIAVTIEGRWTHQASAV